MGASVAATDREEDQWRDGQREVVHPVPRPRPRQRQQAQRERDGDASGEPPRARGERAPNDDHDDHRPGEVPTLARILDRGELAASGGDPLVAGPGFAASASRTARVCGDGRRRRATQTTIYLYRVFVTRVRPEPGR
jgi:hypothetical protein